MWKRLIGILVVLVMALSLPMVALADDGDEEEYCICGADTPCSLTEPVEMPPDTELLPQPEDSVVSDQKGGEQDSDISLGPVPNVCQILTTEGISLLDFLDDEDVSFDYVMPIGMIQNNAAITGYRYIGFSLGDLGLGDNNILRIVHWLTGGSWSFIDDVEYFEGKWWFRVTDFGAANALSVFFALIERGVPRQEAAAIVMSAWETQVLGEVSPDTSDSSIGLFAMIAIMLSALGFAGFAITRAKKEMTK